MGWIVRTPKGEVRAFQGYKDGKDRPLNPKKFCGSVSCIGHASYGDHCKQYRRGPLVILESQKVYLRLKNYREDDYRILLPNGKIASSTMGLDARSKRSAKVLGVGRNTRRR